MKKAILIIALLVLLLPACTPGANPTLTDAEMATRVAAILTGMPSSSPIATEAPSDTPETPQPTPQVVHETPQASNTPLIATETQNTPPAAGEEATSTPKPPSATKTPGDTETPEDTLEPSLTPPNADPRSTLGKATDTDPMDNPDHWTWPVGKDEFTSNGFDDGHMWMTGLSNKPGWVVSALHIDDAYLEETVKTGSCTGSDNYGLIFRVPVLRTANRGYLYAISCDGKYSIWAWDGRVGPKGTRTVLIDWKASKFINAGSNKTNRLGVMAQDNKLTLYVNGAKLDEVKTTTFAEGYVGVFVNPDTTKNFTVNINEIRFWNTAP